MPTSENLNADKMTVRSVERALDILSSFIGHEKSLTLTDISNKVNLHKSTVHRLLNSLEHRGFIEKVPDQDRYRLGMKIIELSSYAARSSDLIQTAIPEMKKLRDEMGETVSLYVRDHGERVRLHAIESTQTVRRIAIIGQRMPLYVGAASKILISYKPVEEQENIFNSSYWPKKFDMKTYRENLQIIRNQGYATSFEERESGVAAVAAPVFYETGKIAAALALSGPIDRFPNELLSNIANKVKLSANHISNMLAYNQITSHDTRFRN
ncbi:hypothetical protein BHU72_10170 [Desulfuribacillus stibiiarsenatis]|uniref:Glycerol operon regulatory protein n=1 Tax=Desulfuribacillus stibiiarsenatis TaxID=1390249 RepID=A0A1E5L8Y3_9FIRM|nr:IclR family transcriptional regulator [Desulfuribacillus stibiiarsenatis]OEH86612.1 hypothetical protein BHU72_10170 [Desulfuribacillus stibiiarsenatis]